MIVRLKVWVVECLGFLGGQCSDWAPWRDAHKSTPPLRVSEGPPRPLFYGAETTLDLTAPARQTVVVTARSHRLSDADAGQPGDQVSFCVVLVGHTAHTNVTPFTLPGGGVCSPVRHAAPGVLLAEDREGLGKKIEVHGVDCHLANPRTGGSQVYLVFLADGARLVPGVSHGLQYLVCVDKATPPPLACGEWHDWSRYSDDPNHHPWKGAYYKQFVPQ